MKKLIFLFLSFSFACALQAGSIWGPTEVKSYGPNGTHWPKKIPTPYPYHVNSASKFVRLEVEPTWDAIKAAVNGLTDAQVNGTNGDGKEGVIIYVRPGNLPSSSVGARSEIMAQDIGKKTWDRRVTIIPRDGYGSVKVNSVRVKNLNGIALCGIRFEGAIRWEGGTRSALAWSSNERSKANYLGDGVTGSSVTDFEVVEVTHRDKLVVTQDIDGAGVSTLGSDLKRFYFVGCYFGPVARPSGKPFHTDSLQFGASPGHVPKGAYGTYEDMFIRDTVIASSTSAGIQTGAVKTMRISHSYFFGRHSPHWLDRYPAPEGADAGPTAHLAVLSGGGGPFYFDDDTYLHGGESLSPGSPSQLGGVSHTYIPYARGWAVPGARKGAYTVLPAAKFPQLPPNPDLTFRMAIWNPSLDDGDDTPPSVPNVTRVTAPTTPQ